MDNTNAELLAFLRDVAQAGSIEVLKIPGRLNVLNVRARRLLDLLAGPSRPVGAQPAEIAAAQLKWLADNEYDLRTHRESSSEDEFFIWWTVVNPRAKKSLSHPYGSPYEAIRAAGGPNTDAAVLAPPADTRDMSVFGSGKDIRLACPECNCTMLGGHPVNFCNNCGIPLSVPRAEIDAAMSILPPADTPATRYANTCRDCGESLVGGPHVCTNPEAYR